MKLHAALSSLALALSFPLSMLVAGSATAAETKPAFIPDLAKG